MVNVDAIIRNMSLEVINNLPVDNTVKPPLLFVHGMWHGAWCWEMFLEHAKVLGYEAHALSFSNHGNSSHRKNINLLSINNYVEELKEVVDSLPSKPILIGHSMGAFVTMKYLEKENVPGAVLLSPVPPFGVWGGTLKAIKSFPITFLRSNLTLNLKHIIGSLDRFKKMMLSESVSDDQAAIWHCKISNESFRAYVDMLGLKSC